LQSVEGNVTAEPKEFNLDELKRMLQRLDKRMQDSPPPSELQGFAPLIPTGRELTVTVQQATLAKAEVRDQGQDQDPANTTVRTVIISAGVSAIVSLAFFALVFSGILTPQPQLTAKTPAIDDTQTTEGLTSATFLAPAPGADTKPVGVEQPQAPVSPPLEAVRAVEEKPPVEASADVPIPKPKSPERIVEVAPAPEEKPPVEASADVPIPKPESPERIVEVAPAPRQEPPKETAPSPKETAPSKSRDTVPAFNVGRALTELDALQLLRRGLNMLSSGNVGAAQLLLERAANLGSGDAAYVLATTYDGAPGAPRSGPAVRPNVDLALRWYERAQALGVADAQKRLSALKKRSSPGG
jgi:outer membrane biosynthesis protein TonB